MPVLFEASGGQALAERLLDQAISQRLQQRSIAVTPDMIRAEQQYLLRSLHADANQAQRLLDEIRQRRGLGEMRFTALLARNAGMRALVKDQVQVSDVAVQQAHEFEHGVRYELRLITTETLSAAADAVRRIKGGESFIDVAVKVSTDESRSQGGLLSPISPVDPTYPGSVRSAMVKLTPGQVSDPVALDRGFAILRLERKIEADGIRFDDVKEDLTARVRRQAEAMMMERLARQLIAEADVTVLEPALQKAWNAQKQRAAEQTK